ncbi:MAG: MarR family winged helix-turn-helix transcriptional regulator [Lactovum sp.]
MENNKSGIDLRLFRVGLKASNTILGNIYDDIESYKLNREHFMLLELLYSKGPHPVQRISEILEIPSGSITYVVDRLSKKGLVKRRLNKIDKRVNEVILTSEGKQFFDEIFPSHVETISKNLSILTDNEKHQLTELLKKVGLDALKFKKKKK